MNELKDFKKQIKIFLDKVEDYLGEDEHSLCEEAFDILASYYFFNSADEIGNDYIQRINNYMKKLSVKMGKDDFNQFKHSVKLVMDFVNEVKPEIPKDIY